MKLATDRELLKLLNTLIELEDQLSQYYHVMAYFAPEHSDTWKNLSQQEATHAKSLEKIHRAVRDEPDRFKPGNFNETTSRMVVEKVDEMRKKILCEEVTPQQAISFIQNVESSVFECYASKVVQTDIAEVNEILDTMKAETDEHRQLLDDLAEE